MNPIPVIGDGMKAWGTLSLRAGFQAGFRRCRGFGFLAKKTGSPPRETRLQKRITDYATLTAGARAHSRRNSPHRLRPRRAKLSRKLPGCGSHIYPEVWGTQCTIFKWMTGTGRHISTPGEAAANRGLWISRNRRSVEILYNNF